MNKIFAFFIMLTSVIAAQELNCTVTVNYENVPVANRERLVDFKNVVESYLNTARYTNDDYATKINCAMSIFFLSAAGDFDYSAQVVVTSQRPVYRSDRVSPVLAINDGQWQFQYQPGQAMYANQTTFDPLTSFLDFYALIIIGMDQDSFGPFAGTPIFLRAMDIANLGATSRANTGWQPSSSVYNRNGLVSEILRDKYSAFRGSIFEYYYGIDIYSQNKTLGQQKIADLVNVLWSMYQKTGNLNSVYVSTFFDAKSGEIADLLRFYTDSEIFSKLKKIDPPHTAKYDAVAP
jgi:uncharacterized protein YmfQ (DUF2313 family)